MILMDEMVLKLIELLLTRLALLTDLAFSNCSKLRNQLNELLYEGCCLTMSNGNISSVGWRDIIGVGIHPL